jgi:hypothetical protein
MKFSFTPILLHLEPKILIQAPPNGKGKKGFAETGISSKPRFPFVLGTGRMYGFVGKNILWLP